PPRAAVRARSRVARPPPAALAEPLEDVARDAIDHRILEAVGPIRDASIHDGAPARRHERTEHRVVVRALFDVAPPGISPETLRRVLELAGLVSVAARLFILCPQTCGTGGKDLERAR